MRKNIYVAELCAKFEQSLINHQISDNTLRRYQKVLTEFTVFACNKHYSQSLGADFLVSKLRERGGLVLSDEESKNQEYYFRCIRFLAEYFNFGVTLQKDHAYGEIIWPKGFKDCTERFFSSLVEDGLSYGYVKNSRKTIKDLILFLDANDISKPSEILVEHNDKFIKSYFWLSSKGISTKLCMLRRYYRYLYLSKYINLPLAERLPQISIQGRMKLPTIWDLDKIQKIKEATDRTSPSGKRSYAMILLAAELGLRIGDIRDLKIENIDWNKKNISIIQNKTNKALILPLSDDVG